jgi:DNA-binding response OmpR family regulator
VRLPDDVLRHLNNDERRKKIATVLTIDDDPNVLDLMARVYQREGFRPVSAVNGKIGIDLARKLRPDLITLDIMMPEMDGWAVLKALKDDAELKDIPVIMVSIVENKPMALDVGALDSLTKFIAWDRLIDLTRKVVRKSQ